MTDEHLITTHPGSQAEQSVVAAAALGDEKAFAELFAMHHRRVGLFLVQMVKSRAQAEDLLQDTFCDALAARARLREVDNVEAWLLGIARNRALRALRRERRWRGAFDRLSQELARRPTARATDAIVVRDLLIRCLRPDERALVLLSYVHGLSSEELAASTGRSPAAVRQALVRARRKVLSAATHEELINP